VRDFRLSQLCWRIFWNVSACRLVSSFWETHGAQLQGNGPSDLLSRGCACSVTGNSRRGILELTIRELTILELTICELTIRELKIWELTIRELTISYLKTCKSFTKRMQSWKVLRELKICYTRLKCIPKRTFNVFSLVNEDQRFSGERRTPFGATGVTSSV
jgi:hypothetical protein